MKALERISAQFIIYAYQKCTSSPWVRHFNIRDTSLSALEGFHCNVVCVVNYLQQFLYNTMIVAFSPSTPRPEPTVVKLLLSLLCCCFVFPSKTIIIFVLKFNHFFLFCVAQSLYSLWPCSQSRNMLENTVQCCCIAPRLWNSQGRWGNLRGIPCLSCWVCMFSREKVTNGSPAQCQCVGERPVCCSTVEGFCADGETGLWNVCYSLQSFQKGVDDYKEHSHR